MDAASLEQKAKAESQKHGADELKSLKHKVELERLRLLCERIVKREKLKRELAISSHEILATRRDHAARSLPVRNWFSPPKVSSDSISGSEAIQRSDDITIDSTASVKRRGKGPILMDTDQKTDHSATSKGRFSRKPIKSQIFGFGSQKLKFDRFCKKLKPRAVSMNSQSHNLMTGIFISVTGSSSGCCSPQVQDLLAQCGEHMKKGDIHHGPAVLVLNQLQLPKESEIAICSYEDHILVIATQTGAMGTILHARKKGCLLNQHLVSQ